LKKCAIFALIFALVFLFAGCMNTAQRGDGVDRVNMANDYTNERMRTTQDIANNTAQNRNGTGNNNSTLGGTNNVDTTTGNRVNTNTNTYTRTPMDTNDNQINRNRGFFSWLFGTRNNNNAGSGINTNIDGGDISNRIKSAINGISGVRDCEVAVNGNTCVVGVDTDNQTNISQIREQIITKVKQLVPNIEMVKVTNDEYIVQSIRNMLNTSGSDTTDAFESIVNSIR